MEKVTGDFTLASVLEEILIMLVVLTNFFVALILNQRQDASLTHVLFHTLKLLITFDFLLGD